MLVVLSGVAGAGKDTIKKELIKRMDNVSSIPSFTTRPPREGDIPGETYVFLSKEEFEEKIKNDEIYEYDIHHNHYYGTSKKFLTDIKIVTIFLRVPREEIRHRLENRIDKPSEGEIILRMNRFDYEESKIGLYDYVLKNDDLEKAVSIIQRIIEEESK